MKRMNLFGCLPFLGRRKIGTSALESDDIITLPNRLVDLSPRSQTPRPGTPQSSNEAENEPTHDLRELDPKQRFLLTAKDVWTSAYNELRDDCSTKSLVIQYEELLQAKLPNADAEGTGFKGDLASKLADLDQTTREDIIDQLAQQRLDEIIPTLTEKETVSKIYYFMDDIKAAVSSALDTCPPAAIAWILICLLVVPVTPYSGATSRNQEGLSYLVSRLPWYNQLVDLLDSDNWSSPDLFDCMENDIQEKVKELYRLLIEYQMRSFGLSNTSVSTIARQATKWNDWNGKISKIKELEQQLMGYIKTYNTAALQNTLETLLRTSHTVGKRLSDLLKHQNATIQRMVELADERDRKEIINKYKLVPTEFNLVMYNAYTKGIANMEPNTGQGVLSHGSYQNWKESNNGLLLLAAGPGIGKSVLAKHVHDSLLEQSMLVCSFFFNDQLPGQNQPNIALRKIFHELLKQLPPIKMVEIKAQIDRLDKESIQSESKDLWDIIDIASRGPAIGGVTIILDALDESDPATRDGFVDMLSDFHSRFSEAKVKILLTTRHLNGILGKFDSFSILNLDKDAACCQSLEEDIWKVAQKQFQDFTANKNITNKYERVRLMSMLQKHKHQSYLAIELLFKYLHKQPPQFQPKWVHIFEYLPANVPQTYRGLLNKVDLMHRNVVKIIIKIMLAAQRPFTVREMNIAVALQLKHPSDYQSMEDLMLMSDQSFGDLLFDSCGLLFKSIGGHIHFIHQTVKDYLLSTDTEHCWLGQLDMKGCHKTLAGICMRYISLPLVQTDSRFLSIADYLSAGCVSQSNYHQVCKDFPFANYGFRYWVTHFREGLHETGDLSTLLAHICARYPEWPFRFAVSVFCCSALPKHVEIKAFLELIPQEYPDLYKILLALSSSLIENFALEASLTDLLFGITLAAQVVLMIPKDHPKKPRARAVLSDGLLQRYQKCGEGRALEMSVTMAQNAISKLTPDHPDYAFVQDQYARSLRCRIEQNNGIADIDMAVQAARNAIDIKDTAQPDLAHYYTTLSTTLYLRAMHFDRLEDLDEAISVVQKTLSMFDGNPSYQASAYNLLAVCHQGRYSFEASLQSLESAVEAGKTAISVMSPDDPHGSLRCMNLATVFEDLYEHVKDDTYLVHAIDSINMSFRLMDDDYSANETALDGRITGVV